MMLVVLVQNSKGGGLVSDLSSSNQILGVRKTTDFLEKATWTLAIVLVVLCLVSSLSIPQSGVNTGGQLDSEMHGLIENTVIPESQVPAGTAEWSVKINRVKKCQNVTISDIFFINTWLISTSLQFGKEFEQAIAETIY